MNLSLKKCIKSRIRVLYTCVLMGRKKETRSRTLITRIARNETLSAKWAAMWATASRAGLFSAFIPNTSHPSSYRGLIVIITVVQIHVGKRKETGAHWESRRQRALKLTRLIIALHNVACPRIRFPLRKRSDRRIRRVFAGSGSRSQVVIT